MVIVDTTVWIDYLRGTENPEASWLVWRLQQQSLGLTDLILCEVLQGIRDPRTLAQVRDGGEMNPIIVPPLLRKPIVEDAAIRSAWDWHE